MAITAVFIDNQLSTGLSAQVPGDKFEGMVEISFASADTYPTGGFLIATMLASLGLKTVTHFLPLCIGPSLSGVVNEYSYDKANGKVKFYANPVTPTETGNVDVSAFKLYALVKGNR